MECGPRYINYDAAWGKGYIWFDLKEAGHKIAHFWQWQWHTKETKRNGIGFCLLYIVQRHFTEFYSARVVNESVWVAYTCIIFFPICFSQVTTFARWVIIGERERCWKVPKWSSARKATGKTAKEEKRENDVKTKNVRLFCLIFGVILL